MNFEFGNQTPKHIRDSRLLLPNLMPVKFKFSAVGFRNSPTAIDLTRRSSENQKIYKLDQPR